MRSSLISTLFILASILAAASPAGGQAPLDSGTARLDGMQARADLSLAKLPLYFVENRGQIKGETAFHVKGSDKTLHFTPRGVTFDLRGNGGRCVVRLDFVGANRRAMLRGEARQDAVFSYFKGRPEEWKTGIPTYGRLVYEDLWPGIDLVYYGRADELKYEFVVAPGADPAQIRLAYRGVTGLSVKETGELAVRTACLEFEDGIPSAFQVIDGKRKEVAMRYSVGEKTGGGAFPYGFEVGSFDRREPLVLDPALLLYCGFIGGADREHGEGIAVDSQGCAYVTGYAESDETTFPVIVGPDLTHNGGPGG